MHYIKRSLAGLFAFAAMFVANAQPSWTVNPYQYQHNMSITAQLYIEGGISSDHGDMVGVFYGEECRGVSYNNYVLQEQTYSLITVYGNTDSEKLTIKIYDASSGEIYTLKQSLQFKIDSIMGTPLDPVMFYTDLAEKKISAYNFFSPNGDGKNDYFIVDDLTAVMDMTFKVLTLDGVEVFRQKDYDNTWDGKNKNGNDLPQGVYYYLFIDADGKTVYKGNVTLVR